MIDGPIFYMRVVDTYLTAYGYLTDYISTGFTAGSSCRSMPAYSRNQSIARHHHAWPHTSILVRVLVLTTGALNHGVLRRKRLKNGPKLLAGTKLTIEECACKMSLGVAMLSWAPPARQESQDEGRRTQNCTNY